MSFEEKGFELGEFFLKTRERILTKSALSYSLLNRDVVEIEYRLNF